MNMRARRKELGLSSRDVAEAVGVTHTTVLSWERKGYVPMSHRKEIAKALGVQMEDVPSERGLPGCGSVKTKSGVVDWIGAVMRSDEPVRVAKVLSAIATFFDEQLGLANCSIDSLIKETRIDEEEIREIWDDVLASGWLEWRPPGEYLFELKYPNDDQ